MHTRSIATLCKNLGKKVPKLPIALEGAHLLKVSPFRSKIKCSRLKVVRIWKVRHWKKVISLLEQRHKRGGNWSTTINKDSYEILTKKRSLLKSSL